MSMLNYASNKQGRVMTLMFILDVIGFVFVLLGAGLIRYSREEIISIFGGFVMAGGVTLLSVTRLMQK